MVDKIPLKREYLQDYKREEYEQIDAFLEKVSTGKFGKSEIFPNPNRFTKLNYPISYIGELDVPIWPVAAFSGSTIIPLMPIGENQFQEYHGFKISEIEQMTSFCEETGKIQFVLMRDPTDYYGLDFLEPIFKRLRPPQFIGFQVDQFGSYEDLCKYYEEFSLITNSGFRNYAREEAGSLGKNKLAFKSYMLNLRGNYMTIRSISDPEFSEYFARTFKTDYDLGLGLLHMINLLSLRPLRNPLRATDAYTLKTISSLNKIRGNGKPVFPCEFGRLLMKKMTFYPESLEACKYIAASYKDEDIIKLFQALKEGIVKNDPSAVEKNEKDLSIALDNIWANKSLLNRINGIKWGVPLALGAMGTIAGSLSGNYTGLLASAGFETVDRLFGIKGDALSEKLGKALAPSYQTIVFDFKERYSLK